MNLGLLIVKTEPSDSLCLALMSFKIFFQLTYSSSWKALLFCLQAEDGKQGTNVHGLHLTHSDQGRYMYFSSIRCEKSGHSLIVCSPLLAVFGSHASHNTPSDPVHFQERNTPEEAIAGPLLHQQLGNSMAERQGIIIMH